MKEVRENKELYTSVVKAGRRSYYITLCLSSKEEPYITITERLKKHPGQGYSRSRLFIYQENIDNFAAGLQKVIRHLKEQGYLT